MPDCTASYRWEVVSLDGLSIVFKRDCWVFLKVSSEVHLHGVSGC